MIVDSAKLSELLKRKGINKSDLCGDLGISSRTVAKIGKGEDIAERVILKICDFLGVRTDELAETNAVLETLRREKQTKVSGGLYHETQIKLTYNSNHIEGSKLTEDQTRYIFETKTLGELPSDILIDDIIETNNHFRCIDYVIDHATEKLSEDFILSLQKILKEGTQHAKLYGAGKYKTLPNTIVGIETTSPANVASEIKKLISRYNSLKKVAFEDIVEFHYLFETIHPFQDGNGRVGRLIAFKQCLQNNHIPFYIDDENKWFYYRGLQKWKNERNYLIETCRFGQDRYKKMLDYFNIKYST